MTEGRHIEILSTGCLSLSAEKGIRVYNEKREEVAAILLTADQCAALAGDLLNLRRELLALK